MVFIKRIVKDDFKKPGGFTLTELMIAVLIIGILGAISNLIFQSFVEKARVKKAVSEIMSLQTKIKAYTLHDGILPDSLADIEGGTMQDPWGNPYQYTNFDIVPSGFWRKDRNLVPINTDYDLFSMGKDGETKSPLTAKVSYDDIIRANDGQYVGRASEY